METYSTSLQVLENDEGVLVAVVDDLSKYTTQCQLWSRSQPHEYWANVRLEKPLLPLKLVFIGMNLDGEHIAGLERDKGAVE